MRWSLCALFCLLPLAVSCASDPVERVAAARVAAEERLGDELQAVGLGFGAPVFLRAFKREGEMELWLRQPEDGPWVLLKTYPICAWSGELGPKLAEGDGQTPEGVYQVSASALNPASRFHLSFNLGFPNAFDRAHGRTGSFLMVHGSCVSIGCYAMTDPAIEEIYSLVDAALSAGQGTVPVHLFPFRLEDDALKAEADSPWQAFWSDQLQPIYQAFEQDRMVPKVCVRDGTYRVC
ncbi:MAG: murein L,D-transpeptidase [Xanthomonadales bacterium]|nr:murein L,D-transpeptidase [Xanthomonadales bacterium]